jgi:DNA-binding LytR/AlgR family response regulator
MTLKTIIIDDEPLAHKVILNYAKELTQLKIVGEFYNPVQAIEFMSREKIDLCLLDINMPKLNGIEFLQTLVEPPLVIITTAYREYALQGYEFDVCDYLVKPFELKRFIKAINKACLRRLLLQRGNSTIQISSAKDQETILLKGDKKVHKVLLDDLLYIESYGSYLKYHLVNELIIGLGKMHSMENALPDNSFVRIHKSYLVNLKKIKAVTKSEVLILNKQLPIGNLYKNNFQRLFNAL